MEKKTYNIFVINQIRGICYDNFLYEVDYYNL